MIVERPADGRVESGERRLQANQPVDLSRRFVAFRAQVYRRATRSLWCVGRERRMALRHRQDQADR